MLRYEISLLCFAMVYVVKHTHVFLNWLYIEQWFVPFVCYMNCIPSLYRHVQINLPAWLHVYFIFILSVFDNSKGFLDRHIIFVQNLILLSLYILFYIYLYSITIKCMVEDLIYCFQMWTSILKKEEFRRFFWYSFPFQMIVSFSKTSWDNCETDL